MNILIDTSVWSLALRRKTESLNAAEKFLVAELSELIREKRARLIGWFGKSCFREKVNGAL
jgi:hypothetical protein